MRNSHDWCHKYKQGQMAKERPPSQGERTDSERYAELRKLVECWQKNLGQAHKDALAPGCVRSIVLPMPFSQRMTMHWSRSLLLPPWEPGAH